MDQATRDLLDDGEELRKLYQFFSMADLATLLGCSLWTIKSRLKRHHISSHGLGGRPPLKATCGATLARARLVGLGLSDAGLDARSQIEISSWRLHVLGGLCPYSCPFDQDCNLESEKCQLRDILADQGFLAPHTWEPEDPAAYYRKRFYG